MNSANRLDRVFAALADPTRRAMLVQLTQGESVLKDLAAPFEMTLPAVAKHLRVLEDAGLVVKSRDAQRRPCRLVATPLQEASAWISRYRKFWEDGFDRIDNVLLDLQSEAVTRSGSGKQRPDDDND